MKKHKIGWLNVPGYTPETWNPIVGCSKISAGCQNCYAERMAKRLVGMGVSWYGSVIGPTCDHEGGKWNGKTEKVNDALEKPLHWRSPRAIFVNSMGDIFHENTPDWMIDEVFGVMLGCQVFDNYNHLFIVLTKRAERMAKYFSEDPVELMMRWARAGAWMVTKDEEENLHSWLSYDPRGYAKELLPLQNVWLGVTAENQEAADLRIPHLLSTPAAVRFVSCEPMIGEIDLCIPVGCRSCNHPGNVRQREGCTRCGGSGREPTLDWVICGGETGPGARKMQYQWAQSLRDQCQEAGVPFFFKQWGAKPPTEYHRCEWKDLMLDGKRYHEFPMIGNGGDE